MVDLNKIFQLRCEKCNYSEFSSGLTKDLAKFKEIKKCASCHGKRYFRCPKCGGFMLMKRLYGGAETHDTPPAKPEKQD